MKGFVARILCVLSVFSAFLIATAAQAVPERTRNISSYHATVGTSTALAIPSANVGPNVQAWAVCNDAVNTSTYLTVGLAVDVSTDGRTIAPGACYECDDCTADTLKLIKVEGQAAANGYSVIQFRK